MSDDNGNGRIIVPKDRTFSRGQGCWNCIHGSSEEAVKFWTERRKRDVLFLKQLIEQAPAGEQSLAVKQLVKKIDTIDHSVAAHALLRCTKGVTAEGKPVGDLVAHNYLCSKWSGKQGSSLAREGRGLDDLPEELADKIDGTPSVDLERLVNKKLIEN
jgi:hypothetical protein